MFFKRIRERSAEIMSIRETERERERERNSFNFFELDKTELIVQYYVSRVTRDCILTRIVYRPVRGFGGSGEYKTEQLQRSLIGENSCPPFLSRRSQT